MRRNLILGTMTALGIVATTMTPMPAMATEQDTQRTDAATELVETQGQGDATTQDPVEQDVYGPPLVAEDPDRDHISALTPQDPFMYDEPAMYGPDPVEEARYEARRTITTIAVTGGSLTALGISIAVIRHINKNR